MHGHTALTARIFCQPGSRGSSWGSSTIFNCYPRKALRCKGLTAFGSRGSSTFNFSAVFEKKEKAREEKEEKEIYTCVYMELVLLLPLLPNRLKALEILGFPG